jgi:DNA-binding IclR family transcriptional regulator
MRTVGEITPKAGEEQAAVARENGSRPPAPNQALANALQVLDLFSDGPRHRGISEISRLVGLDKSTVSRIVATLVQHGYLEKSDDGRRYQVGSMTWLVGVRYQLATLLAETSRVALSGILPRFKGTTGYVGVPFQRQVRYVSVVDGPGAQHVHLEVGEATPMPVLAIGRAMLAHLPVGELRAWLDDLPLADLPPRFHQSRPEFEAELDRIREQGFAVNEGDHVPEIGAIAAPIFWPNGSLVGAVAIDFPMREASWKFYAELAPAVTTTAKQIERILTSLL